MGGLQKVEGIVAQEGLVAGRLFHVSDVLPHLKVGDVPVERAPCGLTRGGVDFATCFGLGHHEVQQSVQFVQDHQSLVGLRENAGLPIQLYLFQRAQIAGAGPQFGRVQSHVRLHNFFGQGTSFLRNAKLLVGQGFEFRQAQNRPTPVVRLQPCHIGKEEDVEQGEIQRRISHVHGFSALLESQHLVQDARGVLLVIFRGGNHGAGVKIDPLGVHVAQGIQGDVELIGELNGFLQGQGRVSPHAPVDGVGSNAQQFPDFVHHIQVGGHAELDAFKKLAL